MTDISIHDELENFKLAGSQLILLMPRNRAVEVIEVIRTVYGSGDDFLRIFKRDCVIVAFSRKLPNLNTILANTPGFRVEKNEKGCFVLSVE